MITLRLRTKFDAAHSLPNYIGKCSRIHGHTWWVDLEIVGEPDKNGIVVDFAEVKRKIDEKFDHRLINEVLENPTAENIAKEICGMIPKAISCRVWESENASAEYREK